MRKLLIILIAFMAITSSAQAAKIVDPNGQVIRSYQTWFNHASEPTVQLTLTAMPQSCPAYPADVEASCVYSNRPRTIWLQPNKDWWGKEFTLFHESFHSWNMDNPTSPIVVNVQNEFMRINNVSGPWWNTDAPKMAGNLAVSSPGELAADAYANCAMIRRHFWPDYWSSVQSLYGWNPTKAQFLATCLMFSHHMR